MLFSALIALIGALLVIAFFVIRVKKADSLEEKNNLFLNDCLILATAVVFGVCSWYCTAVCNASRLWTIICLYLLNGLTVLLIRSALEIGKKYLGSNVRKQKMHTLKTIVLITYSCLLLLDIIMPVGWWKAPFILVGTTLMVYGLKLKLDQK